MIPVCLYFQIHQPHRLHQIDLFNPSFELFDDGLAEHICLKVANSCYIPATQLLLELICHFKGKLKFIISISGIALELFESFCPKVIEDLRALVNSGSVEILNETYFHSLCSLFSQEMFQQSVMKHQTKIKDLFGVEPIGFRNTELIFNDAIAQSVANMGYHYMLAGGIKQYAVFRSKNISNFFILNKNRVLSDLMSFKFEKNIRNFFNQCHDEAKKYPCLNLFLDFEFLGEHISKTSGIFQFFKEFSDYIVKSKQFEFVFPQEVIQTYTFTPQIYHPDTSSWADSSQDLSAWLGNPMQNSAISAAYALSSDILASNNIKLIEWYNRLLTSDNFYWMFSSLGPDGDVHEYFRAYKTPYIAYSEYINAIFFLKKVMENKF